MGEEQGHTEVVSTVGRCWDQVHRDRRPSYMLRVFCFSTRGKLKQKPDRSELTACGCLGRKRNGVQANHQSDPSPRGCRLLISCHLVRVRVSEYIAHGAES